MMVLCLGSHVMNCLVILRGFSGKFGDFLGFFTESLLAFPLLLEYVLHFADRILCPLSLWTEVSLNPFFSKCIGFIWPDVRVTTIPDQDQTISVPARIRAGIF